VPNSTQAVMRSPSIHAPSVNVTNGPIMPTCAVSAAPILSMAIITMRTGATVQAKALISESPITSGGTSAAETGLSNKNCAIQHRQATVDARPTKRKEPILCTNSPLQTRYTA
jgi:hypothetical protein